MTYIFWWEKSKAEMVRRKWDRGVITSKNFSLRHSSPVSTSSLFCAKTIYTLAQIFLKKILLIYFRQRRREEEREKYQGVVAFHTPFAGDKTWSTTQACALTGNRTSDSSVHRPELNPLSCTSQSCSGSFCLNLTYSLPCFAFFPSFFLFTLLLDYFLNHCWPSFSAVGSRHKFLSQIASQV